MTTEPNELSVVADTVLNDENLVSRAAAGDATACDLLYRRYRSFVLTVAQRIGARDHAEDIMHDTFMALMMGGWTLGSARRLNLEAFLTVIVRRACITRLHRAQTKRRGGAAPHLPITATDAPMDTPTSPVTVADRAWAHPLDGLVDREQREALNRALDRLPTADRELLRLRYSGLSYKHMAVITRRGKSSIFMALRRIHHDLAEFFGVTYVPPPAEVSERSPARMNLTRRRARARLKASGASLR